MMERAVFDEFSGIIDIGDSKNSIFKIGWWIWISAMNFLCHEQFPKHDQLDPTSEKD